MTLRSTVCRPTYSRSSPSAERPTERFISTRERGPFLRTSGGLFWSTSPATLPSAYTPTTREPRPRRCSRFGKASRLNAPRRPIGRGPGDGRPWERRRARFPRLELAGGSTAGRHPGMLRRARHLGASCRSRERRSSRRRRRSRASLRIQARSGWRLAKASSSRQVSSAARSCSICSGVGSSVTVMAEGYRLTAIPTDHRRRRARARARRVRPRRRREWPRGRP